VGRERDYKKRRGKQTRTCPDDILQKKKNETQEMLTEGALAGNGRFQGFDRGKRKKGRSGEREPGRGVKKESEHNIIRKTKGGKIKKTNETGGDR